MTQIPLPWAFWPAASMCARPLKPTIVRLSVSQAQTSPSYVPLPLASMPMTLPGLAAAIAWQGLAKGCPGPTSRASSGSGVTGVDDAPPGSARGLGDAGAGDVLADDVGVVDEDESVLEDGADEAVSVDVVGATLDVVDELLGQLS